MINKIINLIDKSDIISFDIFDTLILRPYVKPSDVFLHMERILGLKNFASKRVRAEKVARKNNKEDEITIHDIYAYLDNSFSKALPFELDFEKRICQRNEEMFAAYQYAIDQGKRVIIVSDMYLPEKTLAEILEKNGFLGYERLFVSSTLKKRKASGKIFDHIIGELKVEPQTILHIGDNRHNDVDMAISRGINAVFYPKVIDRFFEEHPNMVTLVKDNPDHRFEKDKLSISLILGINSIVWIENQKDNYWTRLGSLYAGPFLYFFTRWLYENAKKNGIKNIALAARDGFNLVKIFHLFDGKKEFNAHYVYLPRYVSESANIKSEFDIQVFFNELGKTYDGLYNLVHDFARENRQLRLRWEGLSGNQRLESYSDLKSFVLNNENLFISTSERKRNIVFEYLNEKKLFDGDLMIVDSSCTKARPQKLLTHIIQEKEIKSKLHGYYYKVNRPIKSLSQTDIRPEHNRKYQTDKWDLMEFFMSSPERPIIAIKKEGNDFYPVYQDDDHNPYEGVRIKASELLSEGIMKFAEKAHGIFEDYTIIHNLDTAVLYINNLINNPLNRDIAHIKHLHHSVNNDSIYSPLILKDDGLGVHVKKIYGQRVSVKRLTPDFEHFFLAGNDQQLMQKNGSGHLALNVPFINRHPSHSDKVCIYAIAPDGDATKIASTKAWSFQKGAMLQYRPGHHNQIIYTTFDSTFRKYHSILRQIDQRDKRIIDIPVISISPDGKKALCIQLTDQDKISALYPNPPLVTLKSEEITDNSWLDTNGIYLMDIDGNKTDLIFSFSKLLQLHGRARLQKEESLCINQIQFNPDASRFLIGVTFKSERKQPVSFVITSDLSGENVHRVFGKGTNYCWKDINKLIISGTIDPESTHTHAFTAFEVNDISGDFKPIDKTFFDRGGRSLLSPDKRYLLYDTDILDDFPYKKLLIYDLEHYKGAILGYFYADPDLYNHHADLRCDFHMRWSEDASQIIFDSIHEGFRGIYSINMQDAIAEIDRDIENLTEEEIRKLLSFVPKPEKENRNGMGRRGLVEAIKKGLKKILSPGARKMVRKVYNFVF